MKQTTLTLNLLTGSRQVQGYQIEEFFIHHHLLPHIGAWQVTHLPSGKRVRACTRRKDGEHLVQHLKELDIDWTQTDPDTSLSVDQRVQIDRVFKHVDYEWEL